MLEQNSMKCLVCTHKKRSLYTMIMMLVLSMMHYSYAADQQEYVKETRLRQIFYLGTGIYQGSINFKSDQAQLSSDLSILSVLTVGAQWWGDESKGLYAHGAFGFGADLTLPAAYQSQLLSFNQHIFNLGGQYRWHLSARPLAPDISLQMGVYGIIQELGNQTPVLFVNRSTYGPQWNMSFTYPWKAHIWTRFVVGLSIPVLMREDPADSGEMDQGTHWIVQLEQQIAVSKSLGVYSILSYSQETVDFSGIGTRANGVNHGTHDQNMLSLSIALSYF